MSSPRVFTSRSGDSYMMLVQSFAAMRSRRVRRPFLGGRKPSKIKRSVGNPELTSAGTKAVGPGRVSTSMSSRRHSRVRRNPGSLMPGVPASEISAMVSPASSRSMMGRTVACSLNLWWDAHGVSMPKWRSNTPEVRVSSA